MVTGGAAPGATRGAPMWSEPFPSFAAGRITRAKLKLTAKLAENIHRTTKAYKCETPTKSLHSTTAARSLHAKPFAHGVGCGVTGSRS